MKYITKDVRDKLYEDYNTPSHIIGHCREVERVSVLIAERLNDVGFNLNIDLLKGAASVHDLVRLWERHDLECAKILLEKGYEKESELVKKHMRYYPFNDIDNVDEQDLLCLADRLVLENEYAGLEKRMDYIVNKVKDKQDIVEKILTRKKDTEKLINDIESKIGITIDELCKK